MNHEHDDVSECFVTDGERERPAELLGLEHIEGAKDDLVFAPTELFVGMVDPLVRHHPEGEKDDEEDVRAAEHRFAPCRLAVNWSAFANHDDEVRQKCGRKKGEKERLIHAGPSEDVDCDHATWVPFLAVYHSGKHRHEA